jgi:3-phenylpropionate/trans-cinnamate dioxygenase ferredoxin subunit
MYNYAQIDPNKCDFIEVGPAADLENGERWFIGVDELSLVVFNVVGQFFAIADICSHDDGPLGDGDLEGYEIICPRHGARFDVKTGKALALPAVEDISAYPVRVVDGMINVGIPRE